MIKFKLVGGKAAVKKFKKVPNAMLDEIEDTMKEVIFNFMHPQAVENARENFFRNSKGALRRNIKPFIKIIGKVVIGGLGVTSSKVPYARIHENGGLITQTITDKQRKFFWWKHKETGAEMWKRMALTKKKLNIKIKPRPYLRPAIEKYIPLLKKELIKNITDLDKQI